MKVPFFRPAISQREIDEVVEVLRSGWLTSGPRVKQLEESFARAVSSQYAIAVNSGTAALHLAVEAHRLQPGQGVLVPTMTFAATAEVVFYGGGVPVLVDCDATTLNMSLGDAARRVLDVENAAASNPLGDVNVVGMIPVHVGGWMMDPEANRRFADERGLWVVEDAAHAFPASWRKGASDPWVRCGEGTSAISCYSFYANKTITTGEGGMAVTHDRSLAERMRLMSLHGLSSDAWNRYEAGASWDYRIMAAGFKYNLTDIAAALGIHQLARAEEMREARQSVAVRYREGLADVDEVQLPLFSEDRVHAWHLFPIRLRLGHVTIDRNTFMHELKSADVECSVHWRPLHLHPYYAERYGWKPDDFPVAANEWQRLVSLPIFPSMTGDECDYVIRVVRDLCRRVRKVR